MTNSIDLHAEMNIFEREAREVLDNKMLTPWEKRVEINKLFTRYTRAYRLLIALWRAYRAKAEESSILRSQRDQGREIVLELLWSPEFEVATFFGIALLLWVISLQSLLSVPLLEIPGYPYLVEDEDSQDYCLKPIGW